MLIKMVNGKVTFTTTEREARQIAYSLANHSIQLKQSVKNLEEGVICNSALGYIHSEVAERINAIAHLIIQEVGI